LAFGLLYQFYAFFYIEFVFGEEPLYNKYNTADS
jgi:hypothetical protein